MRVRFWLLPQSVAKLQTLPTVTRTMAPVAPAGSLFVGELREYLARWDRSGKSAREKMLVEFVRNTRNMTGPELEREFGNGASLLLTRICAFLKTRVHRGEVSISSALQALSIFLSAASGHRFLLEFLDTGGLQMTLGLMTNDRIGEEDRVRALQLLASIANAGYTYKQMICRDFNGEDAVLSLMCNAKSESAHELIRSVLIGLGRGNKKVSDMQAKLVICLHNNDALVQRTASQVIRQLLSPAALDGVAAVPPDPSLVEAVNAIFCRQNVYVLYEAQELGMTALAEIETRQAMIDSIARMLQPPSWSYERPIATPDDAALYDTTASPAAKSYFSKAEGSPPEVLLQQAASCRLTWSFLKNKEEKRAASREEVMKRFVETGVIGGLLVAMSNVHYSESKKHAMEALKTLCRLSNDANAKFLELTGKEFYTQFQLDPTGTCANFDPQWLQQLLSDTGNAHLIIQPEQETCIGKPDSEDEGSEGVEVKEGAEEILPRGKEAGAVSVEEGETEKAKIPDEKGGS